MQEPHDIHWNASKRIVHYVHGTKHFRIHYITSSPLELVGFTDSDWDWDLTYRKSTSGYTFMISHGPIFWSSNKQHIISISLVEAEYIKAMTATTQCPCLQRILGELGFAFDSSTIIWCDNKSEIKISIDPLHRHKTKHIDIHMHYIRRLVHDQMISL